MPADVLTPPATPPHLEALRAAAARHAADPAAWLRLGAALLDVRELDDAEAALRRAADLAPLDARPLAFLTRVYLHQQRDTEAVTVVQQALRRAPADADALLAFGLVSVRLRETRGVEQAIVLLRQCGAPPAYSEVLRREHARLAQTPVAAASPVAPASPPASTRTARTWAPDEIAIVCGRTQRAWSPRSLDTGIGGSEEAVVRLSRALGRLGWRVTVYNEVGDDAGAYDGVAYRPFDELNRADRFNVVVGWRNVRLFDRPFDARRTYLWLHDYPEPALYARSRLAHIDRIMVLSAFHRAALPRVPDEQFMVTANGIDLAAFERLDAAAIPRDPFRCIYASSYDRGLEVLLSVWGDVRRAVPQAELHVFYGWESFAAQAPEPGFVRWKARMDRLMAQDGVVHRGRVGHAAILEETMRAGVFAYPCTFPETSCITAMKAQAAGAVPVVIAYGALAETVRHGLRLGASADGVCAPAQRDAFRDLLVGALQHPEWQESVRAEMIPWARRTFGWDAVARQWDADFRAALSTSNHTSP